MGLFDEQIRERKRRDQEKFQDSFTVMAEAVMGKPMTDALENDWRVTKDAIESILSYYHVKSHEPPQDITDRNEQIEYMTQPNGIMHRSVILKKGWHRNAAGAMLGVWKETGRAVALIPGAASGYHFINPGTGKKEKVKPGTESRFEEEAILFYEPFPLRKLTIRDILKHMFHRLSGWDAAQMIMATGMVTLIGMLLPLINNLIFGKVLYSGSTQMLAAIACFLISVLISQAMLEATRQLLLNRIIMKMDVSIEAAVMMRILSLPADFFKKYSAGDLARRIEYVNSLCETLANLIMSTVMTAAFSLVYITQIFAYTPALAAPASIILLITLLFAIVSAFVQARISKETMDMTSKESGTVFSIISGIQKIKVAGAEKRAFTRWAEEYAREASLMYDQPVIIKANTALTTAITLIGTIVIYVCAVAGNVSIANYFAFNTAYGMASGAFTALAGVALTAAGIKPILQIAKPFFDQVPEVSENKRMVRSISGRIELSHISFRYSSTMPLIIDDLSMRIRSGEYIAVVGETGCGKSTLMRLLLGFERPQKGYVSYDGCDINSLDLKSLRRKIGVVMQSGKLFQGDIFSNIAMSSQSLTIEQAWEAAEIAGIADDIREMPMGMRTVIGEGAGGISGGQKQRLMIAREIAGRPRVLILDEATSALDNITQKKVSDSLNQLNCTRIVIAHRLSTIRQCDRIILLKEGKIAEDGTYEELIEKDGEFAELVRRQMLDQ